MRGGLCWVALGALLCGGIVGCAGSVPAPDLPRVAERFTLHGGTLQEIADVGGKPLLVLWNEATGTRVFWVSPATAVSRNGRPTALGDLRVGDRLELWAVHGSDVATEVSGRAP